VEPIDVRIVDDEATGSCSLEIWNTVYRTMPASLADQTHYLSYCVDHHHVVAYLGGEPVGSALVVIQPDAAGPAIARAYLAVLQAARGRGVGTTLYRAVSTWARERDKVELESWVIDADPGGQEFAAKRGFVEIGREAVVALELERYDEPAVVLPEGVAIVTWADRPELASGMYEVMREAAPDIPGWDEAIPTYDAWLEYSMGGSSDRPEATFAAVAGDEVIGYAKFHLSDARPEVAVHDLTGVKRAWRGRGVARALKATQIAWAKRNGYERLETANELRNAPIRKLNREFGYEEIPGRALVRGPLAAQELRS
jgi:GNAT superfamily N-acetyltransferase